MPVARKLSPKTRRAIAQILPFGIIWLLLSQLFLLIEWAAIGPVENTPSTAIQLEPGVFLFASVAVGMVGLLVGTIEVLLLKDLFRNRSLGAKIFFKTLVYIAFLYVVVLITFPVAASIDLDTGIRDPQVWDKFREYLTSRTHLSTDVQLAVQLVVSLFYYEISAHMGHGVLPNFVSGKYHTPKAERRVFMFCDMKDSTRIAEQLGHIRYFALLRQYYRDMADAIIAHAGVVYQYVGDEIVITWRPAEGTANSNCVRCFFAMKHDLSEKANWYRNQFGLAPDFKAGLHIGEVTTGEIGALKKEIIFTGDVLNTTSRIQGMCATLDVDILVSNELLEQLKLDDTYQTRSLGTRPLKGKDEEVVLYTIIARDR